MQITNTVVQFTVTIPRFEVDKDNGIERTREDLIRKATEKMMDFSNGVEAKIIDCPSYPALITDPPIV